MKSNVSKNDAHKNLEVSRNGQDLTSLQVKKHLIVEKTYFDLKMKYKKQKATTIDTPNHLIKEPHSIDVTTNVTKLPGTNC